MNENELKFRLQHDAKKFTEAFSASHSQELLNRIMREIGELEQNSQSLGGTTLQPSLLQPESKSFKKYRRILHATIIGASIFWGAGIWLQMHPGVWNGSEIAQTNPVQAPALTASLLTQSQPNIGTSQVSLSPEPPQPTPSPVSSEIPSGTLFNLPVPEKRSFEIPEPVSDFWNDASSVVKVPVDWILEEE